MSHRQRASLLLALSLACIVGCASDGVEVSTTYDPLSRFPAQATFQWDKAANRMPTDDRIAALDIGPRLESAAEAEFAAKGYSLATAGDPDYLLSYQLAVHSWIGADNSRSLASLSLLLQEAASGRRVWLGFGRTEIQMQLPQEQREQRLREAVAKILQGFPPGADK